jgi:hypothetical protein
MYSIPIVVLSKRLLHVYRIEVARTTYVLSARHVALVQGDR